MKRQDPKESLWKTSGFFFKKQKKAKETTGEGKEKPKDSKK